MSLAYVARLNDCQSVNYRKQAQLRQARKHDYGPCHSTALNRAHAASLAATRQTSASTGSSLNWARASLTMVRASSFKRALTSSLVPAVWRRGITCWAAAAPQSAAAAATSFSLAVLRSGESSSLWLRLTSRLSVRHRG